MILMNIKLVCKLVFDENSSIEMFRKQEILWNELYPFPYYAHSCVKNV
jgi:hypothetical protein